MTFSDSLPRLHTGAIRLTVAALTTLLINACTTAVTPPDRSAKAADATSKAASRQPSATNRAADPATQTAGTDMPEGVNREGCAPKPGRQHIFLIHGTLHSSALSFGALAPRLIREGHCLYAVDYGQLNPGEPLKARKPVADNAREVARAIEATMRRIGQRRMDLIGFSQGGLIGFYLIRDMGFADKVRHFTAIAPSVRGTASEGALRLNQGGTCAACADQFHQSAFMRQFTARPITVPGVQYTVVATRDDWIVTPTEAQFVRENGVRNVLIQDRLNGQTVSHVGLVYDTAALDLIVGLVNDPAAK